MGLDSKFSERFSTVLSIFDGVSRLDQDTVIYDHHVEELRSNPISQHLVSVLLTSRREILDEFANRLINFEISENIMHSLGGSLETVELLLTDLEDLITLKKEIENG